jgi:glutamyl-tRNA synthetase
MPDPSVRVRFAPSPTGFLHIGGARTALFNWLFARHNGGSFILRIEDTDRARFQPEALNDIMSSLRWLKLDWDEGPEVGGEYGPYFQSERLDIYQSFAQELLREGHAYHCYCSSERLEAMREEQVRSKQPFGYDRHCRYLTQQRRADYEAQGIVPVIRLAVPLEGATHFYDLIRGESSVENSTLDDLILLKSDGFPTYHLANVIDDHLMRISHIMRADEWLPSVPRHVLLYHAFGWEIPVYAHLPIILSPDGKGKMSKRYGATAVHEFRKEGYIPEGMLNYLARVGWAYDDKTEFFTRDELIDKFSLEHVNKAPAAFSYQKLDSIDAEHIRQLGVDDLADRLVQYFHDYGPWQVQAEVMGEVAPLIQERIKKLSDAVEMTDLFFKEDIEYPAELLVGKKMTAAESLAALRRVQALLEALPALEEAATESALYALAEELGLKPGVLFGVVRVAVTGKTVSPPLFGTLHALGHAKALKRLAQAAKKLESLGIG